MNSSRARRTTRVVATLAVLSAIVGGLWFFAAHAETPGDRAARLGPPERSVITVPVREDQLSERVTASCLVRPRPGTKVPVAATAAAGDSIVTGHPVANGARVDEGDVMIEVSGRPVIAIEGVLPGYRDLALGSAGPDVLQFERALDRLDLLSSSAVDSRLDKDTVVAARALYVARGYPPPAVKGLAIPQQEIGAVPTLPGVVRLTRLPVGATPEQGTLTVSRAGTLVNCDLSPAEAAAMKNAQKLSGTDERGERTRLRFKAVRSVPAEELADGDVPHVNAILTPVSSGHLRAGTTVKVSFLKARAPKRGLVVPVSAVWRDAQGRDVVTVRSNGRDRTVPVTIDFPGEVEVQVSPAPGAALEAGDEVRVGEKSVG